jgi:hypothetical protein
MSDALGPGDLVLCVNAAPNHLTGEPVPLVAGETYRVFDVWEFACPCGRSDALLDVGIGFGWCQSRFRKLPKPKAKAKTRQVTTPKKLEPVSGSGSRAPDRRRLHAGPDDRSAVRATRGCIYCHFHPEDERGPAMGDAGSAGKVDNLAGLGAGLARPGALRADFPSGHTDR